ncbi:BQ5605_C023g09602 [Microbotryum silenes-dioicae]|uniref:BQ5605_C023g09602 protein n=1 Tax=Microbotryum silenes-dioicae TaxID=796604 RepID=A0A2X0MNP4_9BASI|nr:BQ5605_C023g09602 [Microbotryum silenes-dioicae]
MSESSGEEDDSLSSVASFTANAAAAQGAPEDDPADRSTELLVSGPNVTCGRSALETFRINKGDVEIRVKLTKLRVSPLNTRDASAKATTFSAQVSGAVNDFVRNWCPGNNPDHWSYKPRISMFWPHVILRQHPNETDEAFQIREGYLIDQYRAKAAEIITNPQADNCIELDDGHELDILAGQHRYHVAGRVHERCPDRPEYARLSVAVYRRAVIDDPDALFASVQGTNRQEHMRGFSVYEMLQYALLFGVNELADSELRIPGIVPTPEAIAEARSTRFREIATDNPSVSTELALTIARLLRHPVWCTTLATLCQDSAAWMTIRGLCDMNNYGWRALTPPGCSLAATRMVLSIDAVVSQLGVDTPEEEFLAYQGLSPAAIDDAKKPDNPDLSLPRPRLDAVLNLMSKMRVKVVKVPNTEPAQYVFDLPDLMHEITRQVPPPGADAEFVRLWLMFFTPETIKRLTTPGVINLAWFLGVGTLEVKKGPPEPRKASHSDVRAAEKIVASAKADNLLAPADTKPHATSANAEPNATSMHPKSFLPIINKQEKSRYDAMVADSCSWACMPMWSKIRAASNTHFDFFINDLVVPIRSHAYTKNLKNQGIKWSGIKGIKAPQTITHLMKEWLNSKFLDINVFTDEFLPIPANVRNKWSGVAKNARDAHHHTPAAAAKANSSTKDPLPKLPHAVRLDKYYHHFIKVIFRQSAMKKHVLDNAFEAAPENTSGSEEDAGAKTSFKGKASKARAIQTQARTLLEDSRAIDLGVLACESFTVRPSGTQLDAALLAFLSSLVASGAVVKFKATPITVKKLDQHLKCFRAEADVITTMEGYLDWAADPEYKSEEEDEEVVAGKGKGAVVKSGGRHCTGAPTPTRKGGTQQKVKPMDVDLSEEVGTDAEDCPAVSNKSAASGRQLPVSNANYGDITGLAVHDSSSPMPLEPELRDASESPIKNSASDPQRAKGAKVAPPVSSPMPVRLNPNRFNGSSIAGPSNDKMGKAESDSRKRKAERDISPPKTKQTTLATKPTTTSSASKQSKLTAMQKHRLNTAPSGK